MRKIVAILTVVLTIALLGSVKAEEADDAGRWHLTIEPYFMSLMMDGHTAVSGLKTKVSFGMDNLLETLDELRMYAAGRIEVSKGRFAFLYDGMYMKIKDEVNKDASGLPLSINAKVTVQMGLQEWAGAYQIGKWGQDRPLAVDLIAGARQVYLHAKIDTTATLTLPIIGSLIRSGSGSATQSWVNPFIGGRLSYPLSDRLILGFRTDVGGFGAASDFTWNAILETRYYFTNNKNGFICLGYRGFGDYHNEADFKYHLVMHGPVVSGGFRF